MMPRVPTSNDLGLGRQVRQSGASANVNVPIQAVGGEQSANLDRLAGAADRVAQTSFGLQDRLDAADATAAIGQLRERRRAYLSDPSEGVYATQRGRAAVGSYGRGQAELSKIRDEIAGGLSPMARKAFAQQSESILEGAFEDLSRFEARERDAWRTQAADMAANEAIADAAEAWNDPERLQSTLAQGERSIMASLAGQPAEAVQASVAGFRDRAHRQVLDQLLVDNLDGAEGYFETHKDAIDSTRHASIRTEIKRERKRQQAEAEARERERIAGLRDEVSIAATAIAGGRKWAGLDNLRAKVAGTPLAPVIDDAMRGASLRAEMALATPTERLAELAALDDGPATIGSEQRRAAILDTLKADEAALKSGAGLSRAADLGIVAVGNFDVADPDSIRARAEAAGIASQHFGVDIGPLLPNEAAQIVGSYRDAPAETKIALMAELSTNAGGAYADVVKQLVGAGLDEASVFLSLLANRPGASVVANAVVEAIEADPKDLDLARRRHGWSKSDLESEVYSRLDEFLETFDATYAGGAPGNSNSPAEYINGLVGTITRTANVLMRTMDPRDAVRLAANKIINERYEFVDGYRVPREIAPGVPYPLDRLERMQADTLDGLAGLDLDTPESLAGTAERVRVSSYRDSVVDDPHWVTLPDESGLALLDPLGNAVSVDGRPVIVKFAGGR